MRTATHETLRAFGCFALCLGLFSIAYYRPEATPWHLRLTAALAYSSSAALNALGASTMVGETPQSGARLPSYVVYDHRAAVDIAIDCNGSWAFAIFIAAILAVPSTWRAKAWGIAIGVPALWLVNAVRVVSLFWVAVHIPRAFETLHLYVWQYLIIAAAVALLIAWIDRFARPADA